MTPHARDIRPIYHGSIVMVHVLTPAAQGWVDENVNLEDWQWIGNGFAVEPRYVENLLTGMRDAGLEVE